MAIAYMAESVAKDDETAREEMEKSGLVFVEPSDEFKTKIKEIVAPILEKEGDKINKDMYEKLKEATK